MVLKRDLHRREVETEPALDSIPTEAQTPAGYILVSYSLGDPRSALGRFANKSSSAASYLGSMPSRQGRPASVPKPSRRPMLPLEYPDGGPVGSEG
jgi:hypothetical protein